MNPGTDAGSSSSQFDIPRGVCGYIRAEHPDELEIAVQKKEILRYCEERGFRLESIFFDRCVGGDGVTRPGIAGVLGVLQLPTVVGVVVP